MYIGGEYLRKAAGPAAAGVGYNSCDGDYWRQIGCNEAGACGKAKQLVCERRSSLSCWSNRIKHGFCGQRDASRAGWRLCANQSHLEVHRGPRKQRPTAEREDVLRGLSSQLIDSSRPSSFSRWTRAWRPARYDVNISDLHGGRPVQMLNCVYGATLRGDQQRRRHRRRRR